MVRTEIRFVSLGQDALCLVAAVILLLGNAPGLEAQSAAPSPSAPLFVPRPFGPVPPSTPARSRRANADEERKPIPRTWIIGGVAASALVIAALFFFAARAWQSSRFFARQYRFPTGPDVAQRLGGKRSGGHMATANFGPAP